VRLGRAEVDGEVRFCEPDGEGVRLLEGSIADGFTRGARWVPGGDCRMLTPVQPGKILVVLGAFPGARTREEARRSPPRFAAKLVSTLVAQGESVVVPAEIGASVTIEPELAVVLGRRLHRCTPEEAPAGIFGYTCFNDVTHLPFIREEGDFLRAKSVDTFGPIGPWVETGLGEDAVRSGLAIRGLVNDIVVHTGNTGDFTHSVGEVVSEASRFYTLEPGDVISLGTPPSPATATVGDTVRVEIDGLGSLTNTLEGET
jgi:2-keto-4-pentenoate hydratase/2-oxohepta-3-ene-1,7-dioic acid hydratase in catechol pathway